jgi:hypothetical protein
MGVIWNAYQAETSEVLDDQPSEEHRKRVYDWFRNLRASEPRPLLGVYRSARQTAASANLAIGELSHGSNPTAISLMGVGHRVIGPPCSARRLRCGPSSTTPTW